MARNKRTKAICHTVSHNVLFSTLRSVEHSAAPRSGPVRQRCDRFRHELETNFYERNYDGILQNEFLTTPLWGVGSTSPYGHDGP